MIGRCMPAGVLPDARIFSTSAAYLLGVQLLVLLVEPARMLAGVADPPGWGGGASEVTSSTLAGWPRSLAGRSRLRAAAQRFVPLLQPRGHETSAVADSSCGASRPTEARCDTP